MGIADDERCQSMTPVLPLSGKCSGNCQLGQQPQAAGSVGALSSTSLKGQMKFADRVGARKA
jgi:hypothetical protein